MIFYICFIIILHNTVQEQRNSTGWVIMQLLLQLQEVKQHGKANIAVMQCVILWCILLFCLFFLDDRKNLRTSQDVVFVLSHDPHLANWKELDCNFSLIWQSRFILCLINIQHKFSRNVPETKSQFCFWFFLPFHGHFQGIRVPFECSK